MYSDQRTVFSFDVKTADMAAAIADDADLFHIMIPAGKEIEIQNLMGYVYLASDGADFIELVKEDNTVLCKIALQTTGKKAAVNSDGTTATTFPIRVAPQSTTAVSLLKFKADGQSDTSTSVTLQLHVSGLSAR